MNKFRREFYLLFGRQKQTTTKIIFSLFETIRNKLSDNLYLIKISIFLFFVCSSTMNLHKQTTNHIRV